MNQFQPNGTTTFGQSKHLLVPVSVKVCSLVSTHKPMLATSSQKLKNPTVYQKLLDISVNSDLYVTIEVLDGNRNPVPTAMQTPYTPFSGNKRVWNLYVKLPVNYNQIGYDAFLRFTLYEIVAAKPKVFGRGHLLLFDHQNGCVRRGLCKIAIGCETVNYGEFEVTQMEQRLFKYRNGEFSHQWIDELSLPVVEELIANEALPKKWPHYLYVELPRFLLPVVYLDVTCAVPQAPPANHIVEGHADTTVLTDVSIKDTAKLHDPNFHFLTLQSYSETAAATEGVPMDHVSSMDPIERKYQALATNINKTSIVDRELKPLPQTRDELWRILRKPASAVLSDHEKLLLWMYRYFFSKNIIAEEAAPSQTTKQFLTKFLRSFNWENEYELDHVFSEVMPLWTVDKIEIGDALELLSSHFTPATLTAAIRRRLVATNKDINTSEEKKINKISAYAMQLRNFAVDRLRLASAEELLLYLLQLVQALKYESVSKSDPLLQAPLAKFLIDRAVQHGDLGNFFYWYVKVENEDQLNSLGLSGTHRPLDQIYTVVLNTYIEHLKNRCAVAKLPYYKYLKRQIAFIKKLTVLVELIRTTFRKNEATVKKAQFLKDYLSDPANEFLKFADPFPLPLDPSVMICGCYPQESSVFKSSLSPLKITFKTVTQERGKKKYDKYALMFKIGDDLRQDQLVIQIITLMDQLLKNENLDLRLTPYKILATSPVAGLIQFVPNETLDNVLKATDNSTNGILAFLQRHSQRQQPEEPAAMSVLGWRRDSFADQPKHAILTDLGVSSVVMDNYVRSCAGYCVVTYLLGVGDRHLDNLLLLPNGKFWHADFGYILGRDPKPFPPLMKLPIQVIDGMGGMNHENFDIFKSYCFITYTTLRKNSNLIVNLFQLMLNANIPDIQIDPKSAVEKVQDKFALDMTEEEAILHFQNLIIDSVNAFLPVVIDALHSLAQYWRA